MAGAHRWADGCWCGGIDWCVGDCILDRNFCAQPARCLVSLPAGDDRSRSGAGRLAYGYLTVGVSYRDFSSWIRAALYPQENEQAKIQPDQQHYQGYPESPVGSFAVCPKLGDTRPLIALAFAF